MEGEKLEELERALRSQLSEEKLKFIDKYRLQLNSRRRWVCKKNQTPERVYFSHKFAMDNGILEFLFRKYQFCFAKLKYFRKNLDKFSFCKYHPEKGIEDILTIAKKLNAHYATTRPIQDMGLVDESKVLGKTALSVSPKLYIAFGLSGSVQHLGSVNASEIIAINNNKNSAIFRHAKFAILGDARDVAHFIANI